MQPLSLVVAYYLQEAFRIVRIITSEKARRYFRGILKSLAVRQTIATTIDYGIYRHHRVVVTGKRSVPVVLVQLDASQFVHLTRGIAAIVGHQIWYATTSFIRHLAATLCHAVDVRVLAECKELLVARCVTVPHLGSQCSHVWSVIGCL